MRPSERATAMVASSPGVKVPLPPTSAWATFSGRAPRRSANEHVCAEQYGHSAVRLATYIPRPMRSAGAAPNPKTENGRFRRFGTITLYERNAGGQISRYESQFGTTPMSVRTSCRSGPYFACSVSIGTLSGFRSEASVSPACPVVSSALRSVAVLGVVMSLS
jgi:hypothetical protein